MTDEQKVREALNYLHVVVTSSHLPGWKKNREMWDIVRQAALSHASANKGPSRDRASKYPGGMECSTCGCVFVGDESHDECGVCVERGRDVAFAKATVTIAVGREMFRFNSFQQWVNKAQSWFKRAGVPASQFVCIDATGRICGMGKQFMSARDRGAFPVIVYDIDPSTAISTGSASSTAEECSVVGATLSDKAVASFVEESAKIISGAPFPSARSYAKAREITDLVLRAIDQAIAAKRGDKP